MTRPAALAIVHHANQFLVTDGYDNREGLTEAVERYAAALELHSRYGVPASIHLAGTLVEAVAWHHPWFLALVRDLAGEGLLAPIGGAYGENVMPLFDPDLNRRQLVELLGLYEGLLGWTPARVRTAWIPERVWDTDALAPVLADRSLPNGGYGAVLVDDRLAVPVRDRASFDAAGPYPSTGGASNLRAAVLHCRPWRISGGGGLVAVPISAELRYRIPPRTDEDLSRIEAIAERVAGDDAALVVYADDLEKTAGVGGYWDPAGLERFERVLAWIRDRPELVSPVLLDDRLRERPAAAERRVDRGTFYELAVGWGAGEDYAGWAGANEWAPYRAHIDASLAQVRTLGRAEPHLSDLAWKHLLASCYETAWRDPVAYPSPDRAPAPWVRAIASHARACLPIADAARWLAAPGQPAADVVDVDADGDDEVVLRAGGLYAVVSPAHGGRLVLLFHRGAAEARLVVGNPTDHWNWQEELNRYMDVPPNHPGGLADLGFVHDPWRANAVEASPDGAFVELVNAGDGPLCGARKTVLAGRHDVVVCYRLPEAVPALVVQTCLSPDYLGLLRNGRRHVERLEHPCRRGVRNGDEAVWIEVQADERTAFETASEVGHGVNVHVRARQRHFHLAIGCGSPTDAEGREPVRVDAAHGMVPRSVR
jgi:hypothetical protein